MSSWQGRWRATPTVTPPPTLGPVSLTFVEPLPPRQPDIRFTADLLAPASATLRLLQTGALLPPPRSPPPSAPPPLTWGAAVEQEQPPVEAEPLLPRSSQGKTIYTGVAEQTMVSRLQPGGEYACTVTAVNVAGESEPSVPVYFTLPPPFDYEPEPSPSPEATDAAPPPSPESLADALARDAIAALARARDAVTDPKARDSWVKQTRDEVLRRLLADSEGDGSV